MWRRGISIGAGGALVAVGLCAGVVLTSCERPAERAGAGSAVVSRAEAVTSSGGSRGGADAREGGKNAPVRPLRVATWNIEWLNSQPGQGKVPRKNEDYEALRRYAKKIDADIIALQEVDGPEAAQRVFDPNVYDLHFSTRNNVQRVGIATKKHLKVTRHPDLKELAQGGRVRHGVDLTVQGAGAPLRVLAVHLKSGCFSSPLDGPVNGRERPEACASLKKQVPVLQSWLDARQREKTATIVLGDFNRRLATGDDEVFRRLKEKAPLTNVTQGQRALCWGGRYPDFIDHILMNDAAARGWTDKKLVQITYSRADEQRHRDTLSDHCPIRVNLAL